MAVVWWAGEVQLVRWGGFHLGARVQERYPLGGSDLGTAGGEAWADGEPDARRAVGAVAGAARRQRLRDQDRGQAEGRGVIKHFTTEDVRGPRRATEM